MLYSWFTDQLGLISAAQEQKKTLPAYELLSQMSFASVNYLQGVPVVEQPLEQRRHRPDEVPPALLPHRLPLVQYRREPGSDMY